MAKRSIVDAFISSLKAAERSAELDDLVALFDRKAECLTATGHFSRPCDARAFWHRYIAAFDTIESQFSHIVDNGKLAVLEWESSGKLPTGLPIHYRGVSILEYTEDAITKFRTYYDTAALLPHAERSEKHYSESVGQPDISVEISS